MKDTIRDMCAIFNDGPICTAPSPRWHYGVYGAFIVNNSILTVRKSRGPYTGWLDLPGGAPEHGETPMATLTRELEEEVQGHIVASSSWHCFDLQVSLASDGTPIDFRHCGRWTQVMLKDVADSVAPFEDVVNIEWLPLTDWRERDDLSAPLRHVLNLISYMPSESCDIDC